MEAGIAHVFARGNNRQPIFLDDFDRERYLRLFARVVTAHRWRCLGYCLMRNHVHFLIETREPNLGDGMKWLHARYAQAFNRRHHRTGHLFENRYGAVRIESDAQFVTAVRYVARNPVEAGLCAKPSQWRWSSHPQVVRREPPSWLDMERLLDLLAPWGGSPRRRYLELVRAPSVSASPRSAG